MSGGRTEERFRWKGALILFGILFLGVSDTQLIPPLLDPIADDLGILPGRAGTIVTAYAFAAAAFALLLGTASDRYGRKRLISFALVVFTGASLLTYRSSYFSTLLLARMLTGLSAGALSTLALSYAADLYSYAHRGRAMGVLSMAYFLAFIVGIPAGSLVAASFGWRWVFAGLAAAGAVTFLITAWLLPRDQGHGSRADFSSLLSHLSFRDRLSGIAAAFLTSGGLVGFITYIGVWLADQGVGVGRYGFLFMAAGVAATAAAPVSGWLADRMGKRRIIVTANLALAGLFLLVASLAWGALLFAGVALMGVAASARQAPLHALSTELVGPDVRGSYVALRNAASQLGIAIVAAISALAFDYSGFTAVAVIAAVTTMLIIPICRWLPDI